MLSLLQARVASSCGPSVRISHQDLGASCVDAAEGGALPNAALAMAGLPLSAAAATPPGSPAAVVYGCADAAGNAAPPAVRLVTVTDPCQAQGESTCPDTGACSVGGADVQAIA
jgi:hypothetical protein